MRSMPTAKFTTPLIKTPAKFNTLECAALSARLLVAARRDLTRINQPCYLDVAHDRGANPPAIQSADKAAQSKELFGYRTITGLVGKFKAARIFSPASRPA